MNIMGGSQAPYFRKLSDEPYQIFNENFICNISNILRGGTKYKRRVFFLVDSYAFSF